MKKEEVLIITETVKAQSHTERRQTKQRKSQDRDNY